MIDRHALLNVTRYQTLTMLVNSQTPFAVQDQLAMHPPIRVEMHRKLVHPDVVDWFYSLIVFQRAVDVLGHLGRHYAKNPRRVVENKLFIGIMKDIEGVHTVLSNLYGGAYLGKVITLTVPDRDLVNWTSGLVELLKKQ